MKTYVYQVYMEDGTLSEKNLDHRATLEELQSWVGGLIEPVRLEHGFPVIELLTNKLGYVNEEGLCIGLKQNPTFPGFVGPVVVLPKGCRV